MSGGGGTQTTRAEIPQELKPLYRSTAQQMMVGQSSLPIVGPSAWWTAQGRRYYGAGANPQYYNKVAGYDYPQEAIDWGSQHPLAQPPSAWDYGNTGGSGPGGEPAEYPESPGNWGGQPYGSQGQPYSAGEKSGSADPSPGELEDLVKGMTADEWLMYWQQYYDQQHRGDEQPSGGGSGSGGSGDSGGSGGSGGGPPGDVGSPPGPDEPTGDGDWWDDLPYSIPDLDPYYGGGGGKSAGDPAGTPPPGGAPGGHNPYGSHTPVIFDAPADGGKTPKKGGKYDAWVSETQKLASSIGGK